MKLEEAGYTDLLKEQRGSGRFYSTQNPAHTVPSPHRESNTLMSKIHAAIYSYPTTLYSYLQIYAQLLIDIFSPGYYIPKYAKSGLEQLAKNPLVK